MSETNKRSNDAEQDGGATGMEYIPEPNVPLTFAVQEAKTAIISAMNQVKKVYGLPSFIWEGILAEIQTEVLMNEKTELLSDFQDYKDEFRKTYFEKQKVHDPEKEDSDGK